MITVYCVPREIMWNEQAAKDIAENIENNLQFMAYVRWHKDLGYSLRIVDIKNVQDDIPLIKRFLPHKWEMHIHEYEYTRFYTTIRT